MALSLFGVGTGNNNPHSYLSFIIHHIPYDLKVAKIDHVFYKVKGGRLPCPVMGYALLRNRLGIWVNISETTTFRQSWQRKL